MQQRRISADIVNPSTSERILKSISDCDSLSLSHISNPFNPSTNPISLDSAYDNADFSSSTVGRDGTYQSIPNSKFLPQHIELSSINLVGKTRPDVLVNHNLSSSYGMPREKDTRGTFDNKFHGELSQTMQNLSQTLAAPVAGLDASAHSFASSSSTDGTSSDFGASSLLTAPSSCEAFETEPAPSNSPTRMTSACQSHPPLSKESVKQYTYVDSLVDTATIITHALWPNAESSWTRQVMLDTKVLSHFITETLRKSKTSWSTMQLALLYLIRFRRDQIKVARELIGKAIAKGHPLETIRNCLGSMCARRNFLSALILASKYLQDRNFSNKAWSKISGVPIGEINAREREFLEICQWRLDVKHDVFKNWSSIMETFITEIRDGTIFGELETCQRKWKATLRRVVLSSDVDLNITLAQVALSKEVSEPAQLATPAATPGVEVVASYSPILEAANSKAASSLPVSPISPCQLDAPAEDVHLCPFFDEFIHSSPEQSAQDDGNAEASYDTPDSLSLTSPASMSVEESQMSTTVDSHKYVETQTHEQHDSALGSRTVADSHLLLTPKSMSSDLDLYISCDNDCTFSTTFSTGPSGPSSSSLAKGRKRDIMQVDCDNDTECITATELSLLGKRRRTDGAFSRIK